MKLISIALAILLIMVYPIENKGREISCIVFGKDRVYEINKTIDEKAFENLKSLIKKVISNPSFKNINKIFNELEKNKLIKFEDVKPILQNYYINAFCIVAGYGALCFQLRLLNLPFFIFSLPLAIILPEFFAPLWFVLTAGVKFGMVASLSFVLFGSIATNGLLGSWNITFLLADILMIGFMGIWINGLPGVFFVGIASYVQIPFP